MTRVPPPFLLALAACAFAKGSAQPAPPASIVRIELPSESEERQPISVPTEPGNTVEVDLPWPFGTGRAGDSHPTRRNSRGIS
jgi:hypothetical protein